MRGAGKTLCCIYRIYAEFVQFWSRASLAADGLMARKEARRDTSDRGYLRQIFVTHSASLSHKVTE